MNMRSLPLRRVRISYGAAAKYLALLCAMLLMNLALPQGEPLSFALMFGALCCGLNPFLVCGWHLAASVTALSAAASLSASVQAAFLLLVFALYRRFGREMRFERAIYALIAQLPFLFLFPHTGYSLFPFGAFWQKMILCALILALSLLFEGGLRALLFRAFKCRLGGGEIAELALMWLFLGMGLSRLTGELPLLAAIALAGFSAVCLFKSAVSVPFALVLSLPLCVVRLSAVPAAAICALACLALLFLPYGRIAAALALFVGFMGVEFLGGLFSSSAATIAFTLLSVFLPCAAVCCVPEKLFRRLGRTLLFYRERTLPRIAINRNRRAVGEQLFEISALFREIETAFRTEDAPDDAGARIREKLISNLCSSCPNRRKCREMHIPDSMDKLIAVGKAKGRVNLIDLPADLSSACNNTAGLLFALNKQLAEYRRYACEVQAAREGKRLLADQARGISEILRDIALEQSGEYAFTDEEARLSAALASAGILSSEIFLYGDDTRFTASMTLENHTNAARLVKVASDALGVPLALSEKIPLTPDRACFILKRRANFDAAFGVASCPKKGEQASGDTHSILKIDERRFLVALSDGMGSGAGARDVSDQTLSLLEGFYKAKMPSETVLGTVNKLIAFSSEETFSCLDLAAVNLDTGAADIVKIGSPAGFVLSGEELRVLEGESLPIGMLEAVHPATLQVELRPDDFLIFMSDGVTTAFGSSADLCAYLSKLKPLNPQSLAEEILKTALNKYNGSAEDDMTVLAVKLTRAA